MPTTYVSAVLLEQLDHAQADVDLHVASGVDGRCLTCGQESPCRSLTTAYVMFQKYDRLPVRKPGLASRGLGPTHRFGWFDKSTEPARGR